MPKVKDGPKVRKTAKKMDKRYYNGGNRNGKYKYGEPLKKRTGIGFTNPGFEAFKNAGASHFIEQIVHSDFFNLFYVPNPPKATEAA